MARLKVTYILQDNEDDGFSTVEDFKKIYKDILDDTDFAIAVEWVEVEILEA